MSNIRIIGNGIYLPKYKIENSILEKQLGLEKGYIQKRTGIKKRFYAKEEKIEEMAFNAATKCLKENKEVDLIITSTTSTKILMPGISNYIQKKLNINKCICLDILAGCSGYINALDIAKMYIDSGKVKKALIIGVDKLSDYVNNKDTNTSIILADGAGATLIEKVEEEKEYFSYIETKSDDEEILTSKTEEKIQMDGKKVYKYAVIQTVNNINKLLEISNKKLDDIKYIIPHQSNMRIMKSISKRLNIGTNKIYTNIENVGNTFCASIPIALNEIIEKELLKSGDKIILLRIWWRTKHRKYIN